MRAASRVLVLVLALAALAAVAAATAAAAPPPGISANALDRSVDIAWPPAAGATAYSVYRGTSAGTITTRLTPVGGIAATSYSDATATNGTTYFYAVRAVIGGVESANSLAVSATPAAASCSAGNAVVVENCRPGRANWSLRSATQVASGGIEGFATAQSIDRGESVNLKVNASAATTFDVEVYRTGYYGGAGARLLSTVKAVPGTAQPACARTTSVGLVDCSNWSVSTVLPTSASWPSGMYLLRLVRTDNANDNFVLLVVRDDARQPDVLYGSALTTFQAYNNYGGWSLYDFNSTAGTTDSGAPRAVKVSFDRPYNQTLTGQRDWYTTAEIATVYWLEQEGYDVAYASSGDLETRPSLIANAGAYVSPAHDEYWSAGMRNAAQAARDAGVGLFFSGSNEVYWRVRFEASPNGGGAGRVVVCYKTTQSGGPDPSGIPTGTWRDPAGANQPENALTGAMYVGDSDFGYFPLTVSAAQGADRIWRNTGLDTLTPGSTVSIGRTLVGWEWDARVANGFEPAGVKTLAASSVSGNLIQGNGHHQTPGTAVVTMVKYTAPSGALVVTTGTNHWNRGLALNPARDGEPDLRIQQATTNILADMGAQPATPASNIVLDGGATGPPAPTGASAQALGTDSIGVGWSAVAGASGYNVYRALVPRDGGLPLGVRVNPSPVTATTFTDTGLASGTAYYYVVTAIVAGAQSAGSGEATAQTQASATEATRINVGGPAYTAQSGTSWRLDSFATGGSTYAITQAIAGTPDPALYQNERWGQFSYAIPVASGTYDVRFHFAELYYGTAVAGSCIGKRVFGMNIVDTPGATDLTGIDVCAAVGARAALVRTVTGVTVTDGTLNIASVYGAEDDPEVTAIEVVPATPAPPQAPTVSSTTPAAGTTGVASSARPAATFSRAMDPTTITSSSFSVVSAGGATVAYDGTTNTATLTPAGPLASSTVYTATLTTAIRAADATPLATPVTWSFTTAGAPPPDTTPPAVGVTAPAAGATVSGTQAVTATATDAVGVAGVQFTLDGNPFGAEDTSAPYGVSWDTRDVANGAHTVAAVARDAAGNTATSTAVSVTVANAVPDGTPPTVGVSAPAAGASVSGTTTVSATAADNVGVAGVQFKIDGANVGAEDTSAPFSVAWNTAGVPNGQHAVTAVARDAAGNSATSATVTVTVANDTTAPTVSITAPAAGSSVSGTTTVAADAADGVGVAGVQFRVDGTNVGTEDTSAPYSIAWNTTAVASGSHTLTAVARDAAGNTATSAAVTVTVANGGPPPGTTLLGNTAIETGVDFNAAGLAEAFQTTSLTAGPLTALRLYIDNGSTATRVVVGLYGDVAGHPGPLLTQATLTTPVKNAWNTIPVPGVAIAPGTTYWIAVLGPTGSGTLRFRDRSRNVGLAETSNASNLTVLPATWTRRTIYTDGPLSAYGIS